MDAIMSNGFCRVSFFLFSLYAQLEVYGRWIRVPVTIFFGLVLLALILGLFVRLWEENSIAGTIDILPFAAIATVCFLVLVIAASTGETNRKLLRKLLAYWNRKICTEEENIRLEKLCEAKIFITFYSLGIIGAMNLTFLTIFSTTLLDWLMPLNETRARHHLMMTEYFVDEHEYFYSIGCFQYLSVAVVLIMIGVTENVFVVLVHQICAMFAVAAYRLDNLTVLDSSINSIDKRERLLCRKMASCVQEHWEALLFANDVNAACEIYLTLMLISTVLSLSFSLVVVTNIEFISPGLTLFTLGQLGQFFLMSHMGQKLIDSSLRLSQMAYDSRWYDCPARIQKLFLMILLKTRKPCSVMMAKFFALSIENYGSVTQTAMSYCMVLRQMM